MREKAIAELRTALSKHSSALADIEQKGWHVGVSNTDAIIGFFRILKNGKVRKNPTFYLYFNRENTLATWSVCNDQSRYSCTRSFGSADAALAVLITMTKAFDAQDPESAKAVLVGQSHHDREMDRCIDELIGICKGILFGGFVVYEQVLRLWQWFDANPSAKLDAVMGQKLFSLLSGMVKKGSLSIEDEAVLLDFFSQLGGAIGVLATGNNASGALPLDDPAPLVIVYDSLFVLTGHFKLGSREFVTEFIESIGGRVSLKSVVVNTNYLVIGSVGSDAWVHSTHGRKIERAVELRNAGYPLAIISEDHFMKAGAVLMEIARRRLFKKT
jgi:hypothetical protein